MAAGSWSVAAAMPAGHEQVGDLGRPLIGAGLGPDAVHRDRRLGARGQAARGVAAVRREHRPGAAAQVRGVDQQVVRSQHPEDLGGRREVIDGEPVLEAAQHRPGLAGVGEERSAVEAHLHGGRRRGG